MSENTSTIAPEIQGIELPKSVQPSMSIKNFYGHYAGKISESGYPPLPIHPNEKFPAIPTFSIEDGKQVTSWRNLSGWQNGFQLLDETVSGMMDESSLGILCGHGDTPLVAVDIDLMDETQIGIIRRAAVKHLGDTSLIRQGLKPKILMLYRSEKPIQSFSQGKIDIIGAGRQFVAYGKHPTGVEYSWAHGLGTPVDTPAAKLPLITTEALDRFFAELGHKVVLKQAGMDFTVRNSEYQSIYGRAVQDPDKVKGSQEALREALKHIPNRGGWENWNTVGMALYAASDGAAWGFDLFDEWSATSSLHNGKDTCLDRWGNYNRSPPTRNAGAKAIYKMAQKCDGWNEDGIAGAYPDKKDLSRIADGIKARAQRESTAQTTGQLIKLQPAIAAVATHEAIGIPLMAPQAQQPEHSLSRVSNSKSSGVLDFDAVKRSSQNSVIGMKSAEESRKLRAMVDAAEPAYSMLLERLLGQSSRYKALTRVVEALPNCTPRPLALAAALNFMSALCSPACHTDVGLGRLRPLLWILGTAVSGSGKDAPVQFAASCLRDVGLNKMTMSSATSPAAIENRLKACNALVYASDESGAKAKASGGTTVGSLEASILTTLMEIYTKGGGIYQTKSYASSAATSVSDIHSPCLATLMVSTPTLLMEQVGSGLLGGQGNRVLLIASSDEPSFAFIAGKDYANLRKTLTEGVIKGLLAAVNRAGSSDPREPSGLLGDYPSSLGRLYELAFLREGIDISSGGADRLAAASAFIDPSRVMESSDPDLFKWQGLGSGDTSNVLYKRVREQTYRIAMLLQRARTVLDNPTDLFLDETDVQDAKQLVQVSCGMLNEATTLFESSDEIRQIADSLLVSLTRSPDGMARSDWEKLRKAAGEKRQRAERLLVTGGEIYFDPRLPHGFRVMLGSRPASMAA